MYSNEAYTWKNVYWHYVLKQKGHLCIFSNVCNCVCVYFLLSYTLNKKVQGFCSDSIEEPFRCFQRTFHWTILKINIFFLVCIYIYCCSAKFHGWHPVIFIGKWVSYKGEKVPIADLVLIQIDQVNLWYWTTESFFIWKWLCMKDCSHMATNWQWTFFAHRIWNVTTPSVCFNILKKLFSLLC